MINKISNSTKIFIPIGVSVFLGLTVLFSSFSQLPPSQYFWNTKTVDCSGTKLYFSEINNSSGRGVYLHTQADFINLTSKVFGMTVVQNPLTKTTSNLDAEQIDVFYKKSNSSDYTYLKIARNFKSCFNNKDVMLYDGTVGYRCSIVDIVPEGRQKISTASEKCSQDALNIWN